MLRATRRGGDGPPTQSLPAHRVEQHTLRSAASENTKDVTSNVSNRRQDHRAGDDDVALVGFETGHLGAGGGRAVLDEPGEDVVERRSVDLFEAVVR